jgi:hypothetical protein
MFIAALEILYACAEFMENTGPRVMEPTVLELLM